MSVHMPNKKAIITRLPTHISHTAFDAPKAFINYTHYSEQPISVPVIMQLKLYGAPYTARATREKRAKPTTMRY